MSINQNGMQSRSQRMDLADRIYNSEKVKGQSYVGSAKIIFQYLINDINKKPRSFKIGIFSIFLVIGFLAAIQSAFQLSPVIFLAIGEDQIGDADMIITPISFANSTDTSSSSSQESSFSKVQLLNSTQLEEVCDETEGIQGCSPRWMLLGTLYNKELKEPEFQKFRSFIITIDSVKERSVGLGRRFREDVLDDDEAYVTATTVRGLKLKEGQNVTVNIDIIEAVMNNGNVLPMNLTNSTQAGVQEWIANQTRAALVQSYPQFVDSNGKDVNLKKQQIIDISTRLQTASKTTNTYLGREATYLIMQTYLDSQNINLKARDILSPFIENGNLVTIADDLNKFANDLPADYQLNVTTASNEIAPVVTRALNFTMDFIVKKSVSNPNGKWATAIGNSIVVDSKHILPTVWKGIEKSLKEALKDPSIVNNNSPSLKILNSTFQSGNYSDTIGNSLRSVDLNQYAITQNAVFDNRMSIYSSKNSINNNIVKISNAFFSIAGKSSAMQAEVPLAGTVNNLLILKMFLDNLIATSIFLLAMLAVLLIYSLMISDVEEKTYEFGMLRALGFKKVSLIHLIIVEGLVFAIPGLVLGLVMAYVLNTFVAYIIFNKSMMVTTYDLHYSAVILSFGLGLFIPLISVYLPIQRAMSKTLRDSLDLYHRVVNEISVSVQKLEKLGISFAQSFNSLVLILMGVICYYFAPAAFVYQDIALFLAIINMILILMVIGFTLLLNLFQPLVEKVFVKIFLLCLWNNRHLESVIIKNMSGHRRRNSKTALMYTVALAFLIFAGTGFNLQSKSIVDNLKSSLGSDLKVMQLRDLTGLDEKSMKEFLDTYNQENPGQIQDYSFASLPIDKFPLISKPRFSSLSQFPSNRNLQLRGIEKNYLRSVYLEFYYPTEFDSSMSFPKIEGTDLIDAVAGLYSDQGLQKLSNSVDFYKISSNADMRDETLMGGGNVDQNFDQTQTQTLDGSEEDKPQEPISRDKFEDKEIKLIVPSGLHYISSVDVSTPCLLDFKGVKYRSRLRATAKKFPGFRFSSYRQISFMGEIITSMEQFKYLLDTFYYYSGQVDDPKVVEFFSKVKKGSSYGIPKSALTVQFARELTLNERESIGNGLRNFFDTDFTQLFDVPAITESIMDTLYFIDLFSLIVAAISIILSFFLILVSFVSNIKENSWEFGVLRAIGLSKKQITIVYMVESCSLVISSGLIGTIVGITVAVTLTLQLLMFTELPFKFVFPYSMFFTTFFSGLFIAGAGSYSALMEFKDKPVAAIVKGLL